MISLDRARRNHAYALGGLVRAEATTDTERIRLAQESVTRAEKVLVAAELEHEGGWNRGDGSN